jgi:invasion protein IalB
MAATLIVDGALAQQQPQPGSPVLQQFGPRANQVPRQQAPQPEVIATHGDWEVQCQVQAAGGQGAARACGMFQSTQHQERQNVGLTLVVVKEHQEGEEITMLRVMAPIGVYLPTGVALEIDGDAIGRVPFTRCVPQTCIAIAEASPPTLEKMKRGAMANFIIYEGPGMGMGLQLSLRGFTAALAELDKL